MHNGGTPREGAAVFSSTETGSGRSGSGVGRRDAGGAGRIVAGIRARVATARVVGAAIAAVRTGVGVRTGGGVRVVVADRLSAGGVTHAGERLHGAPRRVRLGNRLERFDRESFQLELQLVHGTVSSDNR